MKEYMIELAEEKDTEEILALYRMQLGRKFCPWDEHYPTLHEIQYDLSRDSLYVMRQEGIIIGAISLEKDEAVDALTCWSEELYPGGELARLAVLPELQGQGIAGVLMQYALDELKKRGFKSTHFLVNKYNEKAIRAYAPFEFRVVGECHMYEQDFLCYEKEL